MLLKNEPLENRQVLLTIRVDKEDWQRALQELYNDCSSLYPVEGCAPGKATREQLEAAYGKDFLYQDAVNHTFPEALVEAVAEANLQVAAAPDLSIVDIGPGGYIFTALVQLYPEVKLGQYKGLSAPMDPAELTERDGDEAVARWQQEHLHEEHPERAAMGDEVVLDFEGFVDGVAFDGGKGEKYPLLLGSGMFIPGFEEQVAGIRAGMRLKCWKIMPIFLRAWRSCFGGRAVSSCPSRSTSPEVGRSSRLMQRTSVDLPAPEKPMMPKISPVSTVSETSCTAWTACSPVPKSLEMCLSSIK